MRCFSLAALFSNPICKLIILILLFPPLNICGYNCGYNILYKTILYNFNVHRAEQTETWTHLEWFLEQLSLSQDPKIFSTSL